jgi:phage-related minor tail protein
MIEILRKSQEVFTRLTQKEGEADALLTDLGKREADVRAREAKCTAYESADAVLLAAEIRRKEADAEFARLAEERAKFDNWTKEERAALATEEARLAPLQDQEKQLATDRANLYAREQALEVEKKEFKTRYIDKIKAHFKNTGGAPNPDEIV